MSNGERMEMNDKREIDYKKTNFIGLELCRIEGNDCH
jgi:hypothetical protein